MHNLSFMNARMEKLHSFSTKPSIEIILIYVSFIYSFKHWHNNELLAIVIHNFIIGFISNGSTIALVAYAFMMNLNKDCYTSRILTFKGSTTWSNEGFTHFNSQYCFLITLRCKEKENFAYGCIQIWGYTMPRHSSTLNPQNTFLILSQAF